MISCINPYAQFLSHRAQIESAVAAVFASGRYVLGEQVKTFESEFAAYCGACEGIGVNSGTDAIVLALRACGVGPQAEVVTVSHTAVATVSAIELAGAIPVFADIERDSFTIDPVKVQEAITARTRAIVAVHLYGQAADLDPLLAICRSKGIPLIEDCAQAHGAIYKGKRVGSIGEAGCFSFYPTKNLGAIGDGGMVVTSSRALAAQVRKLREYGWNEARDSTVPGMNSRLDELQAAILRVKLRNLDRDNNCRVRIANQYEAGLADSGIELPKSRAHCSHVYHLYVVRTAGRNELREFLRTRGITTLMHYPLPVHQQTAYVGRLPQANLHETEAAAGEILSLPMYPELSSEEVMEVIAAIREWRKEMGL